MNNYLITVESLTFGNIAYDVEFNLDSINLGIYAGIMACEVCKDHYDGFNLKYFGYGKVNGKDVFTFNIVKDKVLFDTINIYFREVK